MGEEKKFHFFSSPISKIVTLFCWGERLSRMDEKD